MKFPTWFTRWRYHLVHENWHVHLASCWKCERDEECRKIKKLARKCDYWHVRAYGFERVIGPKA